MKSSFLRERLKTPPSERWQNLVVL